MAGLIRRRQDERRVSTRTALLDAAVDVLVDSGLARFSVAAVASRANLSTGALFYNYASRPALIAAMTKHLFDQLETEFVLGSTDGLESATDRAEALVDAVWHLYCDPRMKAALELYAASRTDRELGGLLEEMGVALERDHVDLAARLLGVPNIDRARLAAVVKVVIFTIQGLALDQLPGGTRSPENEVLPILKELAHDLVRPPS